MNVIALILSWMCIVPSEAPKRITLAIMPLASKTLDTEALDILGSTLASDFMNTGMIRIMERSQMERILQEQGFQQSGACDGSECAVEIGKLLTVDRILLGSVGRFGNAYSLSVRMVDVQSGEIVKSVSKNLEGPQEAILTRLVPEVVNALLGLEPPAPPVPKRDLAKEYPGNKGKFKDPRDGSIYPWARIGNRAWMLRNIAWDTVGGHCYQGKSENCAMFGRLYDWKTAMKACPKDWHLPVLSEWDSLIAKSGGLSKASAILKDHRDWDGSDELGFRVMPAGQYTQGEDQKLWELGRLWTASPAINQEGKSLSLLFTGATERLVITGENAEMGMSVRCVLDSVAR